MISKALPELEHFVPAPPTKLDLEYANLRTLDLSWYDQGPEKRAALAEELRLAMTTQGFFILINHGVSEEEIERQVDIGHHILTKTSQEEKQKCRAKIWEEGSYFGFKLRGHWEQAKGVKDQIENFNLSRDLSQVPQPSTMKELIPEIQAFIDYAHKELLFKLLRLFAISLKIEDEDFFVKLHDYAKHDESFLRYMEYFESNDEEHNKIVKGLWLGGHQDLTSVSMLWSQPMASLQVRSFEDDKWRYVKHIPGAMVINCGEVMMWWTGDYYKSAIHRVMQPPADQKGYNRCSTFYFVLPNDEVVINTLLDESPVLREAGVKMAFEPGQAPTSKEWANGRIKITGNKPKLDNNTKGNTVVEQVGKVTTKWYR